MDIQGTAALVTGGASGLGEATVRRLAAGGAEVTILDKNADRGEALAKELGSGAKFVTADVTDPDQVAEAVAMAGESVPLRVAVNCAGLGIAMRTINRDSSPHDLDAFKFVINVNLIGTFNVIRLAASAMAKTDALDTGERGVIVNTASVAAYEGQIGQVAYAASKGGIVGMTLPAARDLAPVGIRVCTIAPGLMDTPLLGLLPDDQRQALGSGVLFPKRLGSADEFGALVAAIAANSYLNGETIRLDGGLRMPPEVKYVEVGGVKLSAIGLGTWQYGSREWGYGDQYAESEAIAITQRALDLGINLIDTAEIYAFGKSERIVGKAIAGRRDEAFLATKVFPIMPLAPIVEQRGRASAKRLGVEQIDLYQVHWPNPVVPTGTTMQGMRALQRDGVINHVGVSNFGLAKWQQAERELGGPVLTNQVQYSLAVRKPDRDLVPWAQQNGRIVIAYSPLAQGLLSARYDGTNTPGGVRSGNALFLPDNVARAQPLLDALRDIAKAHDASPAQVALAWVIRRPNVVAIPGASKVSQLESNAAAADLDLTDDEDARLTQASDGFSPKSGIAAMPDLVRARFSR